MGPSSRARAAFLIATAVALAAFFMTAAPAFAGSLDDTPTATSTTHPADITDTQTWWRAGWGNSLFPQLDVTGPASDDTTMGGESIPVPTLGFLYRVDRNPSSRIDTTLPDPLSVADVHWTQDPEGALFNHTWDLTGVFDEGSGWPTFPGASRPIEGPWYVHIVFGNYLRYSSREWIYRASYDGTKPTAVTMLDAGTSAWTENQRRKIVWSGATDALAGLGAYVVTLSNTAGTKTVVVTQPKPIPPGMNFGEPVESVTLESLAAGVNTISIRAEDRATNLSAAVTAEAKVDTDTPTISVQSPTASTVGRRVTFAAKVADAAGISSVKFYVDGILRYTDTAAPWALDWDFGASGGGSHSVTMQATDMFGHFASASKSFTVHTTPPRITSVSSGPSPFFPRLRDKYKDDSLVKFRLDESSKVTLTVSTGKGVTVRTITAASMPSGSRSLTWNGLTSRGKVVGEGTYYYRLTASDAYGNTTSTGTFPTSVKYYVVVRVSASSAKLVPH